MQFFHESSRGNIASPMRIIAEAIHSAYSLAANPPSDEISRRPRSPEYYNSRLYTLPTASRRLLRSRISSRFFSSSASDSTKYTRKKSFARFTLRLHCSSLWAAPEPPARTFSRTFAASACCSADQESKGDPAWDLCVGRRPSASSSRSGSWYDVAAKIEDRLELELDPPLPGENSSTQGLPCGWLFVPLRLRLAVCVVTSGWPSAESSGREQEVAADTAEQVEAADDRAATLCRF
mmetsp:Transcript_22234/g.56103  ORF Transcript_22234/g.56103 Transcript_22234/m.56103 type:complete len:236 (+) Transcript_22234:351-1058(+)